MIKVLQRIIFLLFLGVVFIGLANFGFSQSFVHPGAMNTKADLDFIKGKINVNEEPWISAYNDFLTADADNYQGINPEPYSSLQYVHHPRESVNCGSYNDPNEGCNDIVYDGMAAYSLALRYYLTDDVQYATKAIEIISDWSDVYRMNTESNSRLVVSWATPWYVNAAEILRYTPNSGWTNTHTNKTNTLLNRFKDYIFWEDRPNNNWMMSSVEARISIAIFQDDRTAFNNAIDKWKERVKTYIYQESDGPTPIPPAGMTQAWTEDIWHDRSNRTGTDYVDGLCMETCRDISHTKLGVNSLLNGAEMAWSQGEDLFDLEKDRFSDFLELHSPWMMGANPPNNICDGYLDIVSEEAFEIAYNHLHDRLGIDLPDTRIMLLRNRPNDANRWVTKWETLCYANRPFGGSNQAPIVSFLLPTTTTFEEGYAPFEVEVDASDPDVNGSIVSVLLKLNGNDIRTEVNPPYQWNHNTIAEDDVLDDLPVGTHTITAIATDNSGATTSIDLTITITEKGVTYYGPVHDAYLQGAGQTRFNTEDLRVENGNRVTYLKFDITSLPAGLVTEAQLELTVGSDAGNGTVTVFQGIGNSWLETNISSANAPTKGAQGGVLSGDFVVGSTYIFSIPTSFFNNNDPINLIVEMSPGGNDVSFASKENSDFTHPILKVKIDDNPPVDCNGDINGTASVDQCGVCSGGNTGVTPNSTCRDCNNEINGTASVDQCGVCSGGNTGVTPNSTCRDCNNEVNGTASVDQCGVCSGGSTGISIDDCLTSINQSQINKSINIYPNPTQGIIYFDGDVEFEIVNSLGVKITSGNSNLVDISNQPSGLYLIRINNRVQFILKE